MFSGAPMWWVLIFSSHDVELQGDTASHLRPYKTSEYLTRYHCGTCNMAVWNEWGEGDSAVRAMSAIMFCGGENKNQVRGQGGMGSATRGRDAVPY